jgi:uncharacterized protein YjbI with pentapeptide repeats
VQFLYEAGLIYKGQTIVSLEQAPVSEANLRLLNLSGVDLSKASLWKANLRGASLRDADLRDADLRGAELIGVLKWTEEQLSEAHTLKGATMPDGSKHP